MRHSRPPPTRRTLILAGLSTVIFILGIALAMLLWSGAHGSSEAVAAVFTLTPRATTSAPSDPRAWTRTPTLIPTATATVTASWTPSASPSSEPELTPTPIPTDTASPPPLPPATADTTPPTLDDFWEGRAAWYLDAFDVGLPFGESDTIVGPDGRLWSYLHASYRSARIRDEWGTEVPFPGCVTRWISDDGGRSFHLTTPRCLFTCRSQPCQVLGDEIDQQQYPRVARAEDGMFYLVYEWGGQAYLRTSPDGLNWSWSARVEGTGIWKTGEAPCQSYQRIEPFPLLPDPYACLSGAPPGIIVEGDRLYVFVGMGKSPAHMGCFTGPRSEGARGMRLCNGNPLFTGASVYGRTDTISPEMSPYFDFHIISSADVMKLGERYYMTYEGMRGTDQFTLGLARSLGPQVDGPWEKYPDNPLFMDVPGNIGVGHADLLVLDGVTYLYTSTSDSTRGRYVLAWK